MSNRSVWTEDTVLGVGWCTPQPKPTLSGDGVHVWRANLDLEAKQVRRLEQNLSVDERVRARRFRFARDCSRFIAARGLLREIVALYLDTTPRQLSFGYSAHGKPFLIELEHGSNFHFNVSHSMGTVLVALAYRREVGVDIEHMCPGLAIEEVAQTAFSTPEKHALNRLEDEAKRTEFLRFWTRKEAYIKADGRGVSLPLERIDVSVPSGRVAVLDEPTGTWHIHARWMLRTLVVGPHCAAALAVEGHGWHLTSWQWTG